MSWWRAPLIAARDALRTYWRSALLIVIAGFVATAAVLPVATLGDISGFGSGTRLDFRTIRPAPIGFHWGSNASSPALAQSEALGLLFQLLLVSAFATLFLASLSILSISAARASNRFPEIAVRRAVGASRRSLFWSAVCEGGALGGAALIFGLVAGTAALMVAIAGWPGSIREPGRGLGLVAIIVTVAVIMVGALFQLLTSPSRRIAEPGPSHVGLYIPALQLGIGLTVLVASTMLMRHASTLGGTPRSVAGTGQVVEATSGQSSPSRRAQDYASLLAELKQDSAVKSVSIMSPGALVGLGMTDAITTDCGYCPDGGLVIKWHLVFATHHFVTPDSFRALGISRVEGRLLSMEDRVTSSPVAVISQSLARKHFQNGEALGRQILLKLDRAEWFTVVGVVEDREPEGFGGEVQPRAAIYLSALQLPPRTVDILIRPEEDSPATSETLRSIMNRRGLHTPGGLVSESAVVAREAQPLRWFGRWFAILGWTMLLITTTSIFVLMRLWVTSLLPELGIQRALGARRGRILRFVLARASLTAVGGVAIAVWFGPALWDSLPDIVAGLPGWSYGSVVPLALVLLIIALAGALLPAIRAARATPAALIGSIGE